MEYPEPVRAVLAKSGASAGDTVEVTARGERYRGVVMPHHSFSGDDILTLKLENGYNIGIEVRDISTVHVVRKHEAAKHREDRRGLPSQFSDGYPVAITRLDTRHSVQAAIPFITRLWTEPQRPVLSPNRVMRLGFYRWQRLSLFG